MDTFGGVGVLKERDLKSTLFLLHGPAGRRKKPKKQIAGESEISKNWQ